MLKVTKFGGSSLCDSAGFARVREIVLADPAQRLRRICARDGISEADARQRRAAQQSDEYYADGATAIFHNNGDMAALEKALHSAISGLRLEWRRYAR